MSAVAGFELDSGGIAQDGGGNKGEILTQISPTSQGIGELATFTNGADNSTASYELAAIAHGHTGGNQSIVKLIADDAVADANVTTEIFANTVNGVLGGGLSIITNNDDFYVFAGAQADGTVGYKLYGDALTAGSSASYRGSTAGVPTPTGSSVISNGDVFPDITIGNTGIWVGDGASNPQFIPSAGASSMQNQQVIGGSISGTATLTEVRYSALDKHYVCVLDNYK